MDITESNFITKTLPSVKFWSWNMTTLSIGYIWNVTRRQSYGTNITLSTCKETEMDEIETKGIRALKSEMFTTLRGKKHVIKLIWSQTPGDGTGLKDCFRKRKINKLCTSIQNDRIDLINMRSPPCWRILFPLIKTPNYHHWTLQQVTPKMTDNSGTESDISSLGSTPPPGLAKRRRDFESAIRKGILERVS